MPSLILIKSPVGGMETQTFPLDMSGRSQIIIGRQRTQVGNDPPADIIIDDGQNTVSRRQAMITQVGETIYIKNIGRNTVLLNNQPLLQNTPSRPLKNEDRLKICGFLFRFQDDRKLPLGFPGGIAEVEDDEHTEATTVQHVVGRNAAQEFLEAAPSERLRALLDISTKLASTLELDKLLPEITEVLFTVFKQADRAFVIQADEAGRLYARVFKSRRNNTDDRFSKTIVRRCLTEMRGFLSEDASSDEEFGAAQSIAEFRIRSFMVVPLATTDGKPLAALQLDTQDVGKKFREDDLKLLTVVANFASVALEKAQVHLALLDREKQQREIELAKQVQLGFLPKTFPQVSGYDFTAFYNAAQTVGGDYYDFIALQDGRVAIMLGDVAGKGVPASLLMAKLSAEARFCIMTQPDPARAINLLNNNLVRGGIGDRFVTLIALVIDSIQNQVTIVNAGHINPLRYRASCCDFNECISEDLIGIPLGVMEGYEYESVTLPLELGDSIIVFTDGVTDAMNPEGVTFELDGVTAALMIEGSLAPGLTPKSIADRVIQAVKKHASGRAQNDDIALVCMGRMIDPHNPGDPGSGPITNTQLDTKRISTLN